MKFEKYKKSFFKIVLNFLVGDYSSWKILGDSILNRTEPKKRNWFNKISIKFIKEKEAKFSE